MVAYSFQPRFVEPILAGTKRQTVRACRVRPHALPGQELQLYTGMRTRQCRLIGRATCVDLTPILLMFSDDPECEGVSGAWPGGLEGFAQADGFQSWADLKAFWRKHHPGVDEFDGWLIQWGDLIR